MNEMISIEEARHHYPSTPSGAHGFDHVLRVTLLAERIAREEEADLEIVRTAALLHDVAAAGPDRENHHLEGASQARRILLALGHPSDRVEAVVHCVQTHRFRKPAEAPRTLEAQCVFDADKLDAIGAVGVARAFVYGAELGQSLWGKVSPEFKAGQDTDEPYTAHHEFYRKLIRIRDRLYTQTGRLIAADRHRTMVDFFNRMAREVAGEA
jgi:uncharacterized protein